VRAAIGPLRASWDKLTAPQLIDLAGDDLAVSRGYDASDTHQTYEMEADENAKPTFEVSNSRYRFALGFA
jgi:hypothetical protein